MFEILKILQEVAECGRELLLQRVVLRGTRFQAEYRSCERHPTTRIVRALLLSVSCGTWSGGGRWEVGPVREGRICEKNWRFESASGSAKTLIGKLICYLTLDASDSYIINDRTMRSLTNRLPADPRPRPRLVRGPRQIVPGKSSSSSSPSSSLGPSPRYANLFHHPSSRPSSPRHPHPSSPIGLLPHPASPSSYSPFGDPIGFKVHSLPIQLLLSHQTNAVCRTVCSFLKHPSPSCRSFSIAPHFEARFASTGVQQPSWNHF